MTSPKTMSSMTVETVTGSLDHLLIGPEVTLQRLEEACRDAADFHWVALTVPACAVPVAARLLRGSGVTVCGAVGMPFGHLGLRAKCDEAAAAIEAGAGEVDLALNLLALRSGRYGDLEREIQAVRRLAGGITLKVTLGADHLTDTEEMRAARLAVDAGADVVKTASALAGRPVRVHDVRLLRRAVGNRARIEAAGGVDRFRLVRALLEEGAWRVGVERPTGILEDFYKWEAA